MTWSVEGSLNCVKVRSDNLVSTEMKALLEILEKKKLNIMYMDVRKKNKQLIVMNKTRGTNAYLEFKQVSYTKSHYT